MSLSLLNLSENYRKAKKDFNNQGIEISDIKLNINKMMSNKEKSVQVLTKGVEFLFKKNTNRSIFKKKCDTSFLSNTGHDERHLFGSQLPPYLRYVYFRSCASS